MTGPAVASFLLFEPRFPRSVRYCVKAAHQRLTDIVPPEETGLPGQAVRERLQALDAWVHKSATGFDPAGLNQRASLTV